MAQKELIGILHPDEQKLFGKEVDALIDFNKFKGDNRWMNIILSIAEKKDDDIFSALVKFLDDRYGDKIPVTIKPLARAVALAVLDKDLKAFEVAAPKLLAEIGDIPRLSKETESYLAVGLVRGIIEAFGATL